jgi:hypothetical protein
MTHPTPQEFEALIAQDRAAGPAAQALRAALPPTAETLAAYLAGTPAPDERARVEQWLAIDPAHRDLLEDVAAGMAAAPAEDAAPAARLAALEAPPRPPAPRRARARRGAFGFRWAGAFASVALLVLAGILVVPNLMPERQSAGVEEKRKRAQMRDDSPQAEGAPRPAEEADRRKAEPPGAAPPEGARRPSPPSPPASEAPPPRVRLAATPAVLAAVRAAAAPASARRESERAPRSAADPLAPFNAACPADWPRCCAAIRLDPALLERVRRDAIPPAFEMVLLGRKPAAGICELRPAG